MKAVHFLFLIGLILAGLTLRGVGGQKTIKVNFDSTNMFTESCGTTGTATSSGFSAADRLVILAKAQSKYDEALGSNVVMVMEGTGGDVDVIISGGQAPGTLQGTEFGDAGKDGKPGVLHGGEFTNFFTSNVLLCTLGETLAHEAGHKFGLDHNCLTNMPSLMTKGSNVTLLDRTNDHRSFTSNDVVMLRSNLNLKSPGHKDSYSSADLGVLVGQSISLPANKPDDRYLDVMATFFGPPGAQFGHIGSANEFVAHGDTSNVGTNFAVLTFPYTAGVNLAVRVGNNVYSLANSASSYNVFNPNPFNNNVSLNAQASWFIPPSDTAQLSLSATIAPATGGFFRVPPIPAINSIVKTGNNVLLGFLSQSGKQYRMQVAPNATSGTWITLPGIISGTGGPVFYTNVGGAVPPQAIYRVQITPPF